MFKRRIVMASVWLFVLPFIGCGGEDNDASSPPLPDESIAELTFGLTGRVWPILQQGYSNQNVTAAQYLLRQHKQSLTVDGEFGWGTRSATVNYQAAAGLSVDGIIGGQTWESLIQTLQTGSQGDAVSAVQYLLQKRYGYSISITGQFGSTTLQRVKQFQKDYCLQFIDGIVGDETWHSLVASVNHCSTGSGSSSFINPAPGYWVSSEFGSCRDGCTRLHKGIDLATPYGTLIKASQSGTVVFAGWMSGYGYTVDISHSNGYTTRYAHLSQFLVYVGKWVSQGQHIAKSGNSGVGTGPHLHFEIRIGGRWGTAVNPRNYINF